MGASVWIAARKKLTESDLRLVSVANGCVEEAIAIPDKVLQKLRVSMGDAWVDSVFEDGGDVKVADDMIEFNLYGHPAIEGRVEHGEGAAVDLSKLPAGTIELRVYME